MDIAAMGSAGSRKAGAALRKGSAETRHCSGMEGVVYTGVKLGLGLLYPAFRTHQAVARDCQLESESWLQAHLSYTNGRKTRQPSLH